MKIDAHQHFWQIGRADYGWLTPKLTVLYQDFMPDDLNPILKRNNVGGTILVQAAPTVAETEFLLNLADENPNILGVVGWVDFASPSAVKDIARLAQHTKLVGLRPMIQDIADDNWMLRADLTPAFDAVIDNDLVFDALVLPKHLQKLGQLLARHPKLRTVIDHAAKPNIADGQIDQWAADIAIVAANSDAFCKLSGLLTEANKDWAADNITPYIEHLLKHFGPSRLVWGSDWPVLNLNASYETWLNLVLMAIPDDSARKMIFETNAVELYKLSK